MSDGDFLDQESLEGYRKELLAKHLNVDIHKPVSYLPIKTIEGMLGLSSIEYRTLIEKTGSKCSIFDANECCIESGAIFAYSAQDLDALLERHRALLTLHAWPVSSDLFIQRIATNWLELNDPIMPVINEAFGKPVAKKNGNVE